MSLSEKYKKKYKKEKLLNKKLHNDTLEYHSDIIILDQNNFKLEQENTLLKDKVKQLEEITSQNSKTLFEQELKKILLEVGHIKKEDKNFYTNALKYLCGYIEALEKYSKGDTKKILEKMKEYKEKTREAQNDLHEIKYGKKTLFKKIDTISKQMKVFKTKIEQTV